MVWLISRSTLPKSRASKRRSCGNQGSILVHYQETTCEYPARYVWGLYFFAWAIAIDFC
jgi:hypothetical protein